MILSRKDLYEHHKLLPESVKEEQVVTLFKSIPLSIAVSILLAVILTWSESDIISKGELLIWNLLMLGTILFRLGSWLYWISAFQGNNTHHWLTLFRAGALTAGAVWGSSAYLLFTAFNPTYQALLAFTLAGVACASLVTLSIDKISCIGFVILTVLPLSLRLHQEHGPTAIPMTVMSLLFLLFVLSASNRASRELNERFNINKQLFKWGSERAEAQIMGDIINQTQAIFIQDNQNKQVFRQLLNDTLEFFDSKFGFIGEVFYDNEHKPYLEMREMTNIAWDSQSKLQYEKHLQSGMIFRNKNSLIGSVLYNIKPIISNKPSQDMRAGGTPEGHPPLTAFLGIPIFNGTQLIGVLGLANNPNGYHESDVDVCKPIVDLISQILIAHRHHKQHLADEEKLLRSLRHTQTILDDAFEAIITTDQHGIIISFNHAAETIFGYKSDEVIGRNASQLMPAPYKDEHDSHLKRYQASGRQNIIGMGRELTGLRKNGKEFPLEIAISEVRHDDEVTFIAMIKDISERHHMDKLKNDFIAAISHDLRTPLTAISASLALLDAETLGKLPEGVKKLISIATHNSNKLERVVEDLLDMDKLINNQLTLNLVEFDLLKTIESSITLNEYLADKHQVKFKIIRAEPQCIVLGDEHRTLQIMEKLLSNAARFSPAHSFIEIGLIKTKHSVKVSVTDYGKGLLPEQIDTLFHRFSQPDHATPMHPNNTMGLSLCKELVEKMGGKMGVTSQINQGSCFYFELPLAQKVIQE